MRRRSGKYQGRYFIKYQGAVIRTEAWGGLGGKGSSEEPAREPLTRVCVNSLLRNSFTEYGFK